MKTNRKTYPKTHAGGRARPNHSDEDKLSRAVLSCLLWENSFYESGVSIQERITQLSQAVSTEFLCSLIEKARNEYNLRHVPLLLLVLLIERRSIVIQTKKFAGKVVSASDVCSAKLVEDTIFNTIGRADELAELVALYWSKGKRPLTAPMKKGLARAFTKFNEYQLAKYNRKADIMLRDVLFLCHAKPKDKKQLKVFHRLANNQLEIPNTWESRLAAGEDKKAVFADLLETGKLGYMALLRNLRGMAEVGVDQTLIKSALLKGNTDKILPFRFISACAQAPMFAGELDKKMVESLKKSEPLSGSTVILVDVSWSMFGDKVSTRSQLTRMDAACALAILLSGICQDLRIFTFSNSVVEVPAFTGLSLTQHIKSSQRNASTYLGAAVSEVAVRVNKCDRFIVITDEQSHDRVGDPEFADKAYMLNVASYENGIGYGAWNRIDGFSESCVRYIQEIEKQDQEEKSNV